MTIDDQAEQDFIYTTFGSNDLWLGMNDVDEEGTWGWSSGDAITYTNWYGAEPNSGDSYDCGYMHYGNGQWYDGYNTWSLVGVVELDSNADTDGDGTPDVLDNQPNDTLDGYDLREAGADGLFDTADDDVYDLRVSPTYGGGTTVDLRLFDGPMHEGHYRLTITPSLQDPVGNPLDGNGDGTGGDAYVRTFYVDTPDGFVIENRGNDTQAEATPLTLTEDPLESGYLVAHGLGSIDPANGGYGQEWNESDYWSFEAQAGDKVAVAVDTPDSDLNAYVYIYNEAGSGLAGDNDSGPAADAYISHYEIPSDGTYYVRVGHYAHDGTKGNYQLRLDVAREIDLESDAGYANDSVAGADPITLVIDATQRHGTVAGTVMSGESGNVDEDYFDLGTVEAGETILATLTLPESSTLQPVIEIRDANNQVVSINPNPADGTVARVDIWETSSYYAVIVALDGEGHFGQYILDTTIAPTSELQFADLSVLSPVAADEVTAGETVRIDWTVGNYGTATTDTDAWYDKIVLSVNEVYGDEDDIAVTSVLHSGALDADASYAAYADVQIPAGLSGDYVLLIKADATNQVFEFNLEDNNTASRPISIVPPPRVTSIDIDAYTNESVSGATLGLSEPVAGDDARDAETYELLYLGADREPGGGDDWAIAVSPDYVDAGSQIDLLFVGDDAVDLTQWTEHDYQGGSAGDWRIEGGGTSVKQYINGEPTFFVSDSDFIDREFVGRIAVETTSDDDFIGLVFGFQTNGNGVPDDYYLVSWKQGNQDAAERGFKLLKITDTASSGVSGLWDGENDAHIQVIARDSSYGWQDNVEYDFSVRYESDGQIDIEIRRTSDQTLLWSTSYTDPASLGLGKVGFFNYSQSAVRYSGLQQAEFLDEGAYQLTAHSGDPGLRDLDGIPIDGDDDGVGGGDYVYRFVVDQTTPEVSGATIAGDSLAIQFDDIGGMDPAAVETLSHYTLKRAAGDATIGDGSDVTIDLSAAVTGVVFDPDTQVLTLTFAETLPDDVYEVTVAAAGTVDLAGNVLAADASETLTLDAAPATVTIELQPGSDTAALDNITSDTTPTFDVVLSEPGSVEVDWTGDGVADYSTAVTTAQTVTFTAPRLAGRRHDVHRHVRRRHAQRKSRGRHGDRHRRYPGPTR